jgi:hypothetical protein
MFLLITLTQKSNKLRLPMLEQEIVMTDDIPLAFAKEILGWNEATRYKGSRNIRASIRRYAKYTGARDNLDYTDMRKVMKFVREWCDKNGYGICVSYAPDKKAWYAECDGKERWDECLHCAAMKVLLEMVRGG